MRYELMFPNQIRKAIDKSWPAVQLLESNQNGKAFLKSIYKPHTIKILFLCYGLPGKSGLRYKI